MGLCMARVALLPMNMPIRVSFVMGKNMARARLFGTQVRYTKGASKRIK